ncbi:MAG: hypothetical protein IT429_17085 [Gemmataceae bacterium]|nr:hypothetical protein [Gemmataceae bacterium]
MVAAAATAAPAVSPADVARHTPGGLAWHASRGRWVSPPHLTLLNRKLLDVAAGRCRRLVISMPPRHGKSELTSRYFPAWFLGSYPDRRVILTSYEANFAAGWGRKARDVLGATGHLFGVKVSGASSAADRWEIEGREGGMVTAGVGGPITGRGADVLIVDDPVKNAEEARSPTQREKAWDWFKSTAYTRLEPNGSVILIMTRWHRDDLAGRLLSQAADLDGYRWEVISLPALATESDPLGRQPGEALWPQRYPAERLEATRKDIEAFWWAALYQQDPTAEGGTEWPPEYFRPRHLVRRMAISSTVADHVSRPLQGQECQVRRLLRVDQSRGRPWRHPLRRCRPRPETHAADRRGGARAGERLPAPRHRHRGQRFSGVARGRVRAAGDGAGRLVARFPDREHDRQDDPHSPHRTVPVPQASSVQGRLEGRKAARPAAQGFPLRTARRRP